MIGFIFPRGNKQEALIRKAISFVHSLAEILVINVPCLVPFFVHLMPLTDNAIRGPGKRGPAQ